MAKVCSVCGKGKVSGNQVSHSNLIKELGLLT